MGGLFGLGVFWGVWFLMCRSFGFFLLFVFCLNPQSTKNLLQLCC